VVTALKFVIVFKIIIKNLFTRIILITIMA
jgi:hypothetical protein